MKYIITIAFAAMFFFSSCSSQQSVASDPAVSDMMESKTYTFLANNVIPTEDARYNPRLMFPNAASTLYQLNAGYDLRVTPDSVIAFLPFFGRSFTAPMNPNEGGIKFTSTDFTYKQSMRKGNYEVEIVPKDARDVRNLYLTVSPGGFAQLRVLSVNRTPISFNGRVDAGR